MSRNKREGAEMPVPALVGNFTYAQVETALAGLFHAEDVVRTTFRARLKHLRKLGIPQKTPGKGARIRYTPPDVFQLLIALELSEFGIDPHLVVDIVQRDWARKGNIWKAIDLAQRFPGDDFHVAIRAGFMSWAWQPKGATVKESAGGISVRSGRDRTPVRVLAPFRTSQALTFLQREPKERFFMFNASERARDLTKALRGKEEHVELGEIVPSK
jgi:hypothetical protein